MQAAISANDVVCAATQQIFGKQLITNVNRGVLAETIIALALDEAWEWCSSDYAPWDFRHASGTKLEVKQSASRQSWHACSDPPSSVGFDIRSRNGQTGHTWRGEKRRWADIYIFAHHHVITDQADHRDPNQWLFYVVEEGRLPLQNTLSLSRVRSLSAPVSVENLCAAINQLLISSTRSGE